VHHYAISDDHAPLFVRADGGSKRTAIETRDSHRFFQAFPLDPNVLVLAADREVVGSAEQMHCRIREWSGNRVTQA